MASKKPQSKMWFIEEPERLFKSKDIPQADLLPKVRQLVGATSTGVVTPSGLRDALKLDARHVAYYKRAAVILGLLVEDDDGQLGVTQRGRELLGTPEGSMPERRRLLDAILAARSLRPFRSFFEGENVSVTELAFRLQAISELSPSTAKRRATTLRQWCRYVREVPKPSSRGPSLADVTSEIENLVKAHNAHVKEQWIEWLKQIDPKRFEAIIGELVVAMGYAEVDVCGRGGDGGVDVRAIRTDKWGHSDRVAIQVKRYSKNVQAPFIDQMIGVMHREKCAEAYIVTTAGFSKGAREGASQAKGLRLIDGNSLVEKLAEFGVGLTLGDYGEMKAVRARRQSA
jgi:restriction endonuclease Mrr